MKKIILSILMALAVATNVSADEIVAVPVSTVAAGDSVVVTISLDNNQSRYYGIQFDVDLVPGFTISENADGPILKTGGRLNGFVTAGKSVESDWNQYRFIAYSNANKFAAGEDGLLSFVIKADADVKPYTYGCRISSITLCDDNYTDVELDNTPLLIEIKKTEEVTYNTTYLYETGSSKPAASNELTNYVLYRDFKANTWSSLVLPFELTPEEVEASFGKGAVVSEITSWSMDSRNSQGHPSTINLYFSDYDYSEKGLEANHPYLIRPVTNMNGVYTTEPKIMSDVPSQPEAIIPNKTNSNSIFNGSFIGTYYQISVPEENLFISSNKFYYSIGNTNIKGYRAYVHLPYVAQSYYDNGTNAQVNFVSEEEATTGVKDIVTEETQLANKKVYNLSGQYVADSLDNLPSGIYIQAGKKVYVK